MSKQFLKPTLAKFFIVVIFVIAGPILTIEFDPLLSLRLSTISYIIGYIMNIIFNWPLYVTHVVFIFGLYLISFLISFLALKPGANTFVTMNILTNIIAWSVNIFYYYFLSSIIVKIVNKIMRKTIDKTNNK